MNRAARQDMHRAGGTRPARPGPWAARHHGKPFGLPPGAGWAFVYCFSQSDSFVDRSGRPSCWKVHHQLKVRALIIPGQLRGFLVMRHRVVFVVGLHVKLA